VSDKVTVGAVALIGLLASIAALMYVDVPPENRDLLNVALMALIGNAGTAFGYFFGSSQGSQKKDETINKLSAPDVPSSSVR
jgi:hypothetical protein